jgi:hypothetical protein
MKTTILGIISLLLLGQIGMTQPLPPDSCSLMQAERQLQCLWMEAEMAEGGDTDHWQAEKKAWEATWDRLAAAHTARELAAFARELEDTEPSELELWMEAEGASWWPETRPAHFSPSQ